ncbi:hypothetical protein D3C81_2019930 [compost metagenome]
MLLNAVQRRVPKHLTTRKGNESPEYHFGKLILSKVQNVMIGREVFYKTMIHSAHVAGLGEVTLIVVAFRPEFFCRFEQANLVQSFDCRGQVNHRSR